jgi:hypothetical protein
MTLALSLFTTTRAFWHNYIVSKIFGDHGPKISPQASNSEIIIYAIAVVGICFLIFLAKKANISLYLQRILPTYDRKEQNFNNKSKFSDQENIIIPTIQPESPHLHLRVKELFELKYQNENLTLECKLNSTKNSTNILYGATEDHFDINIKLILCEDSSSKKKITLQMQEDAFNSLQRIDTSKYKTNPNKNINIHYYYIITNGRIKTKLSVKSFLVWTEDHLLNNSIDFAPYLKNKLIDGFENDKLFSAIKDTSDRKTLKETFISPNWQLENSAKQKKKRLEVHFNTWLKNNNEAKHLVLLGDYGMGKTSFFKYYAATIAQTILNEKQIIRYPVFISLTNTSPIHGGVDKLIESFVSKNLGVNYALFEKLVQKGKILFLIDSFDEMGYIGTHEQQYEQFKQIWQLATTNNKIILSGRPSYFIDKLSRNTSLNIPSKGHESIQTGPYTEVIKLEDLGHIEIKEYLRRYYPQKYITYFEWLTTNEALLALCKRPSMMHIIREMIPDLIHHQENLSANEVMGRYINYWVNRQNSKAIQSAFLGHENQKQKFLNEFYSEIAESFYLSGHLKQKGTFIIKKLREFLKTNTQYSFLETPQNLEGLEREILSAYFLEIDIDDEYKFVHKSFFEFFVAAKIINLLKSNNSKVHKNPLIQADWTTEIIDFTYDEISRKRQERNIKFKNDLPSLLVITNNKTIQAKIKGFLFKLSNYCFHSTHLSSVSPHQTFGLILSSAISILSTFIMYYYLGGAYTFKVVSLIGGIGLVLFNLFSSQSKISKALSFLSIIFWANVYWWGAPQDEEAILVLNTYFYFILILLVILGVIFKLVLVFLIQAFVSYLLARMSFFRYIAKAYYIDLLKGENQGNQTAIFHILHEIYNYKKFNNIKINTPRFLDNCKFNNVSFLNINTNFSSVFFDHSTFNSIKYCKLSYSTLSNVTFKGFIEKLIITNSNLDLKTTQNLLKTIRDRNLELGKNVLIDPYSMLPLIKKIIPHKKQKLNDFEIGEYYITLTEDHEIELAKYYFAYFEKKEEATKLILSPNAVKNYKESDYMSVLVILTWNDKFKEIENFLKLKGIKEIARQDLSFDLIYILILKNRISLAERIISNYNNEFNKNLMEFIKSTLIPDGEKRDENYLYSHFFKRSLENYYKFPL